MGFAIGADDSYRIGGHSINKNTVKTVALGVAGILAVGILSGLGSYGIAKALNSKHVVAISLGVGISAAWLTPLGAYGAMVLQDWVSNRS